MIPNPNSVASTDIKNPVLKFDLSMKIAFFIGTILMLYLFYFYPNLVRLSFYSGIFLCLGLYIPRYAGWQVRERRAKHSKLEERKKWGFASRDREGPWINYIDYPLVLKTTLAQDKLFYSDWLVIENGKIIINPGKSSVDLPNKTVAYALTQPSASPWDGCSPKRLFYWFALLIGTPDLWHGEHKIYALNEQGLLTEKTVFWQLCMHASLVHDALYQYLDNIPISKKDVDQLFHQMLIEAGTPILLAKCYYFAVKRFGANDVALAKVKTNSKFNC